MMAFYLNNARLQVKLFILALTIFCCMSQVAFALSAHQRTLRQRPCLASLSPAVKEQTVKLANKDNKSFSGNISWYGIPFNGRKTASGEIFDMNKLTAAHLALPFGTRVLVEDPKTGNTVIVRVNDRGPHVKTRVMDLAKEGARQLGTLSRGVVFVDCLIISEK